MKKWQLKIDISEVEPDGTVLSRYTGNITTTTCDEIKVLGILDKEKVEYGIVSVR